MQLFVYISISAVCLHSQFQLFVYIPNFSYLFTFQFQLFVYIFNFSCLFTFTISTLFTFLITAFCLHFQLQLFVYISKFSCLFTFSISAVCLLLQFQLCLPRKPLPWAWTCQPERLSSLVPKNLTGKTWDGCQAGSTSKCPAGQVGAVLTSVESSFWWLMTRWIQALVGNWSRVLRIC